MQMKNVKPLSKCNHVTLWAVYEEGERPLTLQKRVGAKEQVWNKHREFVREPGPRVMKVELPL